MRGTCAGAGDVPISPEDTFCTLEPKLAAKGAELLVRVLDDFRAGRTQGMPQDEAQVTFARKLAKEDGRVDWSLPAEAIRNQLRGFAPWPGAYAFLPGGELLKIHEVKVETGAAGALPGTVLEARARGRWWRRARRAAADAWCSRRARRPCRGRVFVRPQTGGRRTIGLTVKDSA
jgi:methionyl-tRNA formyltransferase